MLLACSVAAPPPIEDMFPPHYGFGISDFGNAQRYVLDSRDTGIRRDFMYRYILERSPERRWSRGYLIVE